MSSKRLLTALAGFLLLVGCSASSPEPEQPNQPTVTVSYPVNRQITDFADYTGRTAATDLVEVRARVTGYLDKINFTDGDEVTQGALLYQIDPRPYQAAVDQAVAQVKLQEAQLRYQEALYQRDLVLYGERAVAKEELQQVRAQRDTTRASLVAAKASAEQAKLNLGFTRVEAPISGLLGRALVTRGNLIIANQTLLTTLVSQDPMYAYFDVDEPTVLRVRQLIREGKFKSARDKKSHVPVFLGLANEKGYPHEGYVDFVNNQVNQATATLQVRGVFANPRPSVGPRLLSPGLFVRIRVSIGLPYKALLVNPTAIGTDQDVRYLYVLDGENKVVRHNVKVGSQQPDGLVVVAEGLKPEERVVVEGVQHVQPGVVAKPRLVPMPIPRPGQAARSPTVFKTPPAPPAKPRKK